MPGAAAGDWRFPHLEVRMTNPVNDNTIPDDEGMSLYFEEWRATLLLWLAYTCVGFAIVLVCFFAVAGVRP
jgi:hypothetical protein